MSPVKFKGTSEYDRSYKWLDSIKSASYVPPHDVLAPEAGKPSSKMYKTEEPAFSHKKRIFDRHATQELLQGSHVWEQDDNWDEGRDLQRQSRTLNRTKILTPQHHSNDKLHSYNTRSQSVPAKVHKPTCSLKTKSPKLNPVEYPHPNDRPFNPPNHDSDVTANQEQLAIPVENLSKTYAVKKYSEPVRQRVAVENGYNDQTHDKEVANHHQDIVEAEKEQVPLRFRKRNAPRKSTSARLTEYGRQFSTNKSPTLAASKPTISNEEIVYRSNPALRPPSKRFEKKSHYEREFADRSTEYARIREAELEAERRAEALFERQNSRRMNKQEIQPIISSKEAAASVKKPRHWRSEYQSNFNSSRKIPADVNVTANIDTGKTTASDWVAEVAKRREAARSYKRRQDGTHFSKRHMSQLLSKSADVWDIDEVETTPQIQALDLANHVAGMPTKFDEDQCSCSNFVETERSNESHHDHQKSSNKKVSYADKDIKNTTTVKSAWDDEEVQDTLDNNQPAVEPLSIELGRVPTPELEVSKRHHLDRTTAISSEDQPKVHVKDGDIKRKFSHEAKEAAYISMSPTEQVIPDSAGMPTTDGYELDSTPRPQPDLAQYSNGRPIHLSKSLPENTIPSRKEMLSAYSNCTANGFKKNETIKPIHSKPLISKKLSKTTPIVFSINGVQNSSRKEDNRQAETLKPRLDVKRSSLKEEDIALGEDAFSHSHQNGVKDLSKTYNVRVNDPRLPRKVLSPRQVNEDAVDRFSHVSIASSMSLASDTLAKAKKHREEFWAK